MLQDSEHSKKENSSEQKSMFTEIIKKTKLKKTKKQSENQTTDECVNSKNSLLNASCLSEKRKRTDHSFEEQSSDESSEFINYSKKQRKDSSSTEEIEVSSLSKKKKSIESKQSKYDPESFQKLLKVSRNSEKNKEQERKSVRQKGNTTSEERLPSVDLSGFVSDKKIGGKVTGEPHISGTKTAAKRQKLERQHDTSKRKTNESESVESDLIKPTLSETGFLWDVKPGDLSKPEEECVEDNNEVSFIYFYCSFINVCL